MHKLLEGKIVRREDLDTVQGMTIQRLRTVGARALANDVNMTGDPPELSEDVRFSLMLDR